MATLAHKLSTRDYFALAFGTMIGSGWLVVMDDWLGRGGPAGAMLAFGIGGFLLLPVGWVYGRWGERFPEALGETADTAEIFSGFVSFVKGWVMRIADFILFSVESVSVGR